MMRLLLVVYDNNSLVSWFPQGLAYIASVARKAGHDVVIYNQDLYHWPESHLLDLLNEECFDVIGVSAVGGYYQYRKVLKISEAINQSNNRPFYILGGHLAAPEPDFFLRKTGADAIVIGEGEATIIELLEALEKNDSLGGVKGIAYNDGKFIKTEPRPLIQNIDLIPFPAWDLFPINFYALLRLPNCKPVDRCMPVLSGRGCTFSCNFCFRMDQGFRPRSSESIIEEIQILQRDYAITYITFSDELLMSSTRRTIELCEAFLKAKLNIKWDCNGRLNYARPDVLKLMKEAGCVFINYGIESLDEQALRTMHKALTVKQIISGVENTLSAGISPGLNILFGNIGETAESLQCGVEFLLQYDDHAQMRTIRPVTPYPGSPLYYHAMEKGLLNGCEDFYERKHVNSDLISVNFTDLTDDQFHKNLCEANEKLIKYYFDSQLQKSLNAAHQLYFERDVTFRGFRQT